MAAPVLSLSLIHISTPISAKIEMVSLICTRFSRQGPMIRPAMISPTTCVGVAVPLAGGTLLYSLFYGFSALGSQEFYRALFIGTIKMCIRDRASRL